MTALVPRAAAVAPPTAAPWDTDGDVVWSGHGAGPGICQTIESPAGAHFAPVQNEAERRANARLIAASPELLGALRELTEFFSHNTMPGAERRIEQAWAAIARAEGR